MALAFWFHAFILSTTWFTRALLCTLLGVKSDNTISNHIEALVNRGISEVTKFFVTSEIPTNSGVQQTTLYDLKVFNYLVMRLDTDRAWEMKAKFNDVLACRNLRFGRKTWTFPTISNKTSSHRGRLLLTPCNAKRAEPCAQRALF